MKLVTYRKNSDCTVHFGFILENKVFSFKELKGKLSLPAQGLDDIYSYVTDIDAHHGNARTFQEKIAGTDNHAALPHSSLDDIQILPPIPEPAALLDFGLSPRHLINSGRTLMKHELPWPLSSIVSRIVARSLAKPDLSALKYYKGNHNEISGPGDTVHWPVYTSYLDVEPELAFITGLRKINDTMMPVVAGYCILNDVSARDVQFPEMIGLGLTRSKDFYRSNGLGPFLVTPDELEDPLDLNVSVTIGDRFTWHGTTAEYAAPPAAILDYLKDIFAVMPGTVIGMGTIPGCCGLDNDLWLCPGDAIDISFDVLGTLSQKIPDTAPSNTSRWRKRKELEQ